MLTDSCKEILEHPEIGKNYDEINHHILGLKVSKHIIFYTRVKPIEIEVLRILRRGMDSINRMQD